MLQHIGLCTLAWLAVAGPATADALAPKGFALPVNADTADIPPAADDPHWQAFDPSVLNRPLADVPANGIRKAWIRLQPSSDHWPDGPLVLRVEHSGLQRITLIDADGTRRTASLLEPHSTGDLAHGALAFSLDGYAGGSQPVVLMIDASGVIASPIWFRLLSPIEHRRIDARWLALSSSSLAVMLAMGLMALMFALYLRDSSFTYYAGYVVSYALILCLQSGFAATPLGLDFSDGSAPWIGRTLTAASVVFAVLFLDRFAMLRSHAPRWRRALQALAAGVVFASLLSMVPLPSISQLGRGLTNPLLILGGPLLLAAAISAAWRGSSYALVFLAGWLPLLLVTVLGSIQLYGPLNDWRWLNDGALLAGAFEALVLSLGLARRSLDLRRERDAVRRLADLDPLTGLLNRRAWTQQVKPLAESAPHGRLSLLFIDVDHFKNINDRHGHDTGDQVLVRLAVYLRAEFGSRDLLARHGGEELIVAMADCGPERARRVAERIRRHVEGLDFWPVGDATREPLHLSVSIGVASLDQHESLDALIHRADQAMYKAKSEGRNRVAMLST